MSYLGSNNTCSFGQTWDKHLVKCLKHNFKHLQKGLKHKHMCFYKKKCLKHKHFLTKYIFSSFSYRNRNPQCFYILNRLLNFIVNIYCYIFSLKNVASASLHLSGLNNLHLLITSIMIIHLYFKPLSASTSACGRKVLESTPKKCASSQVMIKHIVQYLLYLAILSPLKIHTYT